MPSMPWFRMYHEFATDPKVQMLSEGEQRRFVMLLCLRCSNGDVTLHDEEVAFQLRISSEQWHETKAVLTAKGMIDADNKPTKWDARQKPSDSSKQRVFRHRQRKKLECNDECNVTETVQKKKEKEIEKKKEEERVCAVSDETRTDRQPEELFEEFWQAFPPDRRRGKGKTRQAFAKAKASPETIIQAVRDGRGIDPACPPMPITWLNQGRWEDDPHQTKQSDGLPAWKAEKMRKAKEFYELCGGVIANG